jgi:D-glycero-D-manno-heptose 1,7-bisphosphate phosphatase
MDRRPEPALFFDRDGVLNQPVWDRHTGSMESPLDIRDVVLAVGASTAVRRASAAGLKTVIVSNQPSAAKGAVDIDTVHAVHERVLALLAADGAVVDSSYLCLHHAEGTLPALSQACNCRKPAPGMLLSAANDLGLDLARSWLIGDTDADVGAARSAGLAGVVLVQNPLSAHRRGALSATADAFAEDAAKATEDVLRVGFSGD